jgi:two-component system response regulator DevR
MSQAADHSASHPVTVQIVDDHQVLVEALRRVVENEADLQVVGEAGTCADCLSLIQQVHPAVLLLDVNLPDGDGLSLVPKINQLSPQTAILVLTTFSDEATLLRAIDLGVSGFVSKNRHLSEVLAAIRQVASGEIAIPASLLLGLLGRKPKQRGRELDLALSGGEPLTTREREILRLLAEGKSGPEIAEHLSISPLTVRTHIRNLMDKLGVHSRLEAVTYALRQGLIDSPI